MLTRRNEIMKKRCVAGNPADFEFRAVGAGEKWGLNRFSAGGYIQGGVFSSYCAWIKMWKDYVAMARV